MTSESPKQSAESRPVPAAKSDVHVAVLGGWRRTGDAPLPAQSVSAAVIGGANVDLSRVALPDAAEILQVSFVGGLDVTVPPGTRVEVRGLRLLGRRQLEIGPADANAPVLTIHAWGVIGGVHVHH